MTYSFLFAIQGLNVVHPGYTGSHYTHLPTQYVCVVANNDTPVTLNQAQDLAIVLGRNVAMEKTSRVPGRKIYGKAVVATHIATFDTPTIVTEYAAKLIDTHMANVEAALHTAQLYNNTPYTIGEDSTTAIDVRDSGGIVCESTITPLHTTLTTTIQRHTSPAVASITLDDA